MTLYAPQIRIHQVLERTKTQTVTLPVYRDGAIVAPSAGTYTLISSSGTEIVSAAVTIAVNIAQYTIPASKLPSTLELNDGYLEKWSLTIGAHPNGDPDIYDFQRPAAVARTNLYPVISDYDLESVYSDLASIRPGSSFQTYIDEAWYQIIQRIRMQGNIEYLILDPQALRESHLDLTFYLFWRDCDSSGLGEGRYFQLAKEHREIFETAFARINFRYDEEQTGRIEEESTRQSARPVLYTANPGNYWGRRY